MGNLNVPESSLVPIPAEIVIVNPIPISITLELGESENPGEAQTPLDGLETDFTGPGIEPIAIQAPPVPIELASAQPEPVQAPPAPIELASAQPEPVQTPPAPVEPVQAPPAPIELASAQPEPVQTPPAPVEPVQPPPVLVEPVSAQPEPKKENQLTYTPVEDTLLTQYIPISDPLIPVQEPLRYIPTKEASIIPVPPLEEKQKRSRSPLSRRLPPEEKRQRSKSSVDVGIPGMSQEELAMQKAVMESIQYQKSPSSSARKNKPSSIPKQRVTDEPVSFLISENRFSEEDGKLLITNKIIIDLCVSTKNKKTGITPPEICQPQLKRMAKYYRKYAPENELGYEFVEERFFEIYRNYFIRNYYDYYESVGGGGFMEKFQIHSGADGPRKVKQSAPTGDLMNKLGRGLYGMYNTTNDCFMLCMLQAILSIRNLRERFMSYPFDGSEEYMKAYPMLYAMNMISVISKTRLVERRFIDLFKTLLGDSQKKSRLHSAYNPASREQQDTEEFLRVISDLIIVEERAMNSILSSIEEKKNRHSDISNEFFTSADFQEHTTCSNCGDRRLYGIRTRNFCNLSPDPLNYNDPRAIETGIDISKLLDLGRYDSIMDQGGRKCRNCSERTIEFKEYTYESIPSSLKIKISRSQVFNTDPIIHNDIEYLKSKISRDPEYKDSLYDKAVLINVKFNVAINFKEEITIEQKESKDSPIQPMKKRFRLTTSIFHLGGAESGHYLTVTNIPNDPNVVVFNDSSVYFFSKNEFFSSKQMAQNCVYLIYDEI